MSIYLRKIHALLLNRPLLFIFLIFILVQSFLFFRIGVFTGLEAEKYIDQGNLLYTSGHFSDAKYIFYLPVILLVYLCRLLGVSYGLVVAFQVVLSAVSLFYFYKLATLVGNKAIAFYSALLLALFTPLQTWNFFLYSDSIFISLTIIYTYIIYQYGDKGIKGTVFILLFLCLLVLSRPHGLLFIPPTIIYLVFRKQSRLSLLSSLGLSVLMLGLMYVLLNTAFTGGGDMDAMKPFVEEHIICFVPLKPGGADINVVHTDNPVGDLFYYILHNPLHFLRLMGLKLLSFFNMTRSYYSTGHNIFLLIFFVPVYIFSLIGLKKLLQPFRSSSIFLLSLLVLYPLGATFQCDDWHSRFTMVVFPYFILLAALGVLQFKNGSVKK